MNKLSELSKATILKLALRVTGVNVKTSVEGIGSSIKEDVFGLYKIDNIEGLKPNELKLYKNITTKLVYNKNSPFELIREGERYNIVRNRKSLMQVSFSKRPVFYNRYTSKGIPMKEVVQVMGEDCMAIAIDKQCHYFKNGDFCKYCNCTPTNLESKIKRISDLSDIEEIVSEFGNHYRFFDLTGGTFQDRDMECRTYTQIGGLIKKALNRKVYSGPFSLSPPINLNLLEDLRNTGVDVISFNPDIWDEKAFADICPGKSKIGKKHYEEALKVAKDLWGEGNAVVQYLIGPWESNESILEGVRYNLDKGILVNLTTFFPSPKSSLRSSHPKTIQDLFKIYLEYGKLIREQGFYPNERKSILTSESANRSSISNEVAKGYLTKEEFEFDTVRKFLEGKLDE
jgi:hypothetical protein